MRIIFWGTPEYSIASLDILIKSKHEVIGVVSQPDKKRSRGNKLISSPLKSFAEQESIKIYTPAKIRDNIHFINELKSLSCDLFIVIAYGKILPKEILEIPKFGCWNAHASLLPRWRGAAPIQWSLIKGDVFTGVGIMKMNEGLDTGPILSSTKIQILENDTSKVLSKRLSLEGAKLVVKVLDSFSSHSAQAQPTKGITYAKKIDKSEAKIDWSLSAETIDRKIRALSPFPGAWTEINGERVKLLASKVIDKENEPGKVLDRGFSIACGQKAVEITEAQRPGKSAQNSDVFLRGFKLQRGSKLD